jgi:acyl dehydratase
MAGLCYEEFSVGMRIEHPIRRTATEMDNMLFSALTYNCAPLHIDHEYCKSTIFGKPLINSMFIFALVNGVIVIDTTIGTTLGNLGYDEVKFVNPVFAGDTIHVVTEVVKLRESQKRTDSGIVWFRHIGYNQHDEIVCECTRAGLMLKRKDYEALIAKNKAASAASKAARDAAKAAAAAKAAKSTKPAKAAKPAKAVKAKEVAKAPAKTRKTTAKG